MRIGESEKEKMKRFTTSCKGELEVGAKVHGDETANKVATEEA